MLRKSTEHLQLMKSANDEKVNRQAEQLNLKSSGFKKNTANAEKKQQQEQKQKFYEILEKH